MPCYFFEITQDGRRAGETSVIDLPDVNAAWEEATTSAAELLKELDGDLKPGHHWRMSVQDEFRSELRAISIITESRPLRSAK